MTWAAGPWLGLDFESTGVDPTRARIVTACCAYRSESDGGWTQQWMADAGGEEIPAGATAIHGITTAQARAQGRAAGDVAVEIHTMLHEAWSAGVPVVCFNAPYDLTLLHCELLRAGHETGLVLGGYVLDPLVLDRHFDRWRKGSRKLGDVAKHYGVRHSSAAPGEDEATATGAHDAMADILATLRVLWQLGRKFSEFADKPLAEIHDLQTLWHRTWAASFTESRRRKDPQAEAIDGTWPYRAVERVAA